MSEKRYVAAIPSSGSAQEFASLALAQDWAATHSATVYELGPEVKEPDYTKLVAWARLNGKHETRCGLPGNRCCHCGLTDALKEAGLA